MRKKLSGWKIKFLNIARHTILANSCLNNIPIHIMRTTKLPATIINATEKIQRNFVWGTTMEKKKLHLINWDTVILSKENGGVGLQKASIKNYLGWQLGRLSQI